MIIKQYPLPKTEVFGVDWAYAKIENLYPDRYMLYNHQATVFAHISRGGKYIHVLVRNKIVEGSV
jgi:hypothetical protein